MQIFSKIIEKQNEHNLHINFHASSFQYSLW